MTWTVTYEIARYKPGEPPRTDTFKVEIEPHRTVLDGIEMIWAYQDRTLTFRHACHHASCGSCAFVVNGVEVLPCIVEIQSVVENGGTLRCEPLYSFPVVSDLVVDMGPFFEKMRMMEMPSSRRPSRPQQPADDYNRFENCIECGMCMSACPVVATDPNYLGPAPLAAAIASSRPGHPRRDQAAHLGACRQRQRALALPRGNGMHGCLPVGRGPRRQDHGPAPAGDGKPHTQATRAQAQATCRS